MDWGVRLSGSQLEVAGPGARCPPDPLGFIALCLLQQGDEEKGGLLPARPTLLFASLQIGAQVASLRCPILRWSKGWISRFRFLEGL